MYAPSLVISIDPVQIGTGIKKITGLPALMA
jgi:hypothetical protein